MSRAATTERDQAWAIQPGALRRLSPVFLAGGLAGVIAGGLGSRLAMRLTALAAPDRVQGLRTEAEATIGEITVGGTMFLLFFAGLSSAIVGTAFYLAVREWLPTRRWQRALAFGGLELVVFGSLVLDPGNPDFTILERQLLSVAVFASLFVAHGVLLVTLQRPARRFVEVFGGGVGWREALVTVVTVGAAALTSFGLVAFGLARGGSIERLLAISLIACAAGLAFISPDASRPRTRRVLRVVGGTLLAVITVSQALELLDSMTTIV